jgi:hypothetical protein
LPIQWFAGKDEACLDMHMIPEELWRVEPFEDFIIDCKKLIRQQFAYLPATLAKAVGGEQ